MVITGRTLTGVDIKESYRQFRDEASRAIDGKGSMELVIELVVCEPVTGPKFRDIEVYAHPHEQVRRTDRNVGPVVRTEGQIALLVAIDDKFHDPLICRAGPLIQVDGVAIEIEPCFEGSRFHIGNALT